MAMISDACFSLRIPAPNHRAHPPGCVAKLLSYHWWRFALLCQPQNVPVGSLDRIFRLPIPLMQFFRCVCCLDFDTLSHTS
jgi:hypothetical protein